MFSDYTSEESKAINALQKIHDLTQLNSPKSAGVAWYEFISSIVYSCGRSYSAESLNGVICSALRSNDMNPRDFGL